MTAFKKNQLFFWWLFFIIKLKHKLIFVVRDNRILDLLFKNKKFY